MSNILQESQGTSQNTAKVAELITDQTPTGTELGLKVRVVSSPAGALPTGAATAARQDTGNTSLSSIDTKLTSQATAAKQDTLLAELQLKADLTETQPVSVASLPLPTNAATSALQTTGNSSLSSLDTKLPAQGQALAGASTPVVLPVAQITALTPPAAITGFLTEADFDTKTGALTEAAPASDTASSGLNGRLQRIAQRLTSLIALLPTSLGQKARASSLAVTLSTEDLTALTPGASTAVTATDLDIRNLVFATDKVDASGSTVALDAPTLAALETITAIISGTVTTKETRSATPSQSSPAVGNTNTSILALNANRLGATIYNEGSVACFVKLGGTASATSYTVKMAVDGYYEVPFGYTGAIDGITASGTATLRVTEFAV